MSNKPTKKRQHKPRATEHITLGESDIRRRTNLLVNIRRGVGKATQQGKDILYIVGSESFGFIEYTILNCKLYKDDT